MGVNVVTDEQEEVNIETFMALGRFVVSFSNLLNSLEESTVYLFGLAGNFQESLMLKAALSDRTAYPISSSFFSVFFQRWGDSVTEEDAKIMGALRNEINNLIKKRNRVMHDAWMNTSGGVKESHPMSTMRVRAHSKGAEYDLEEQTPEKVLDLVETAKRLSDVVTGVVWYCKPGMKGPEVAERFHLIDKKVFRKTQNA
ncbi:hypothetical protein [Shewanella algae]|uniref:hypothetical protein n=1 Tax=Shewanella algae TaxID=38313 RepID=UPI0031F5319B